MKKKLIIFMTLIWVCLSFSSCKDKPANVQRIGSGYIQQDHGNYFVEIDSIRYFPDEIYTNLAPHDKRAVMKPVDGMLVTCFRIHNESHVRFMAGEKSKEYLEDYFTTPSLAILFCVAAIVILLALILLIALRPKKQGPLSSLTPPEKNIGYGDDI